MNDITRERITQIISPMLDRIIRKRTVLEPVVPERVEREKPFGFRLVPFAIWKASAFERSFVTSLGQIGFEQIAKAIAEDSGAFAETQHRESVVLNSWKIDTINNILQGNRENRRRPNWQEELNEIYNINNPAMQNVDVLFDLYVRRPNGAEEYYSIKTVKPNIDQAEVAKKDMLRIKAAKPECEAYFALPYNPAGEGEDYRRAHTQPYTIFNMDDCNCVLIGAAFWNRLGNNPNTYQELLDVFAEVGQTYSHRITTEFLND